MKYVTGTTNREYICEGYTVPKNKYTNLELERGRSHVLSLSDENYQKLLGNGVFRSLKDSGIFLVFDEYPEHLRTETESIKVLQDENKALKARLQLVSNSEALLKEVLPEPEPVMEPEPEPEPEPVDYSRKSKAELVYLCKAIGQEYEGKTRAELVGILSGNSQ